MAIEKFESGKWYKWTGPPKRRSGWNGDSNGLGPGHMDFILDGAPHKVNEGDGENASFFDSPGNGDTRWDWGDGFEYFQEVPGLSDSMPRRLTVGDRVIIGPKFSECSGKHGKIIDRNREYWKVKKDDGSECLHNDDDVEPEPPVKTSGEEQKATIIEATERPMVAMYMAPTYGYQKIVYGRLSRVQERQRAREARLSRI